LDYVKSLPTTTFVTSALLSFSAVIVMFMMRATPYSWTDYGLTLKNWQRCLADALFKTAIFILTITGVEVDFSRAGASARALVLVSLLSMPFVPIRHHDFDDLFGLLHSTGNHPSQRHSALAHSLPDGSLCKGKDYRHDHADRRDDPSAYEKHFLSHTQYFLVHAL
jgi:hypothetical protein